MKKLLLTVLLACCAVSFGLGEDANCHQKCIEETFRLDESCLKDDPFKICKKLKIKRLLKCDATCQQ